MLKQIKLLKETYKTLAGAQKRCSFENAIAGHHYHYSVVQTESGWRIARNTRVAETDIHYPQAEKTA